MHGPLSRAAVLIAAVSLSACGLTPTQQKWAGIAAGVLVVGAIAAHSHDSGTPTTTAVVGPTVPCTPQPNGSCR